MKYAILPILVVLTSNVLYNICAKETPAGVSIFASLALTYLIAALVCVAAFILSERSFDILKEVHRMNWTAVALALAIVGLEFGYILTYRAGWPVSLASIVSNVLLAIILLVIGLLFYHEKVTMSQAIGLVMCLVGLVFAVKD